jgi:IclR helix-turn-helix domain
MFDESDVPRNSSYLVPCVFKAVQMIEALREARTGLRVEDFLGRTGYSRSTIYRILRTLSVCDYIVRASGGVYRLNRSIISVADENLCARPVRRPTTIGASMREGPSEFERWGRTQSGRTLAARVRACHARPNRRLTANPAQHWELSGPLAGKPEPLPY